MRYKSKPGVILTSICDHYFLVSSREIIEVNETAAFYWSLLAEGSSEEELFRKVCNQYDIDDEKTIQTDIHSVLSLLKEHHMVMGYSV